MATQPWYTYPQDSPGGGYGEILDPFCANGSCSYLKPDTNICVPSGVPITNLLSGTVSGVRNMFGQPSVTIALDNPPNNLATHIAYNFLGSSSVNVGQRVSAGQQIGIAKGTGVCTAVALTSDPIYGTGAGFQQNAIGNKLLDPRPLLQAAIKGTLANLGSGSNSGSGSSSGSNCAPWDVQCIVSSIASSNTVRQVGLLFIGLLVVLIGITIVFFGKGKEES